TSVLASLLIVVVVWPYCVRVVATMQAKKNADFPRKNGGFWNSVKINVAHIGSMRRRIKDELIKARCDAGLKRQLEHVAVLQQMDVSDIIRIACSAYVLKYQQPNYYAERGDLQSNPEGARAARV